MSDIRKPSNMVSPLGSLHQCESTAFLFWRSSANKLQSHSEPTVEIYDAILYQKPVPLARDPAQPWGLHTQNIPAHRSVLQALPQVLFGHNDRWKRKYCDIGVLTSVAYRCHVAQ